MTEMVHGSVPVYTGDPVIPRWWRTVDKGSLAAVLGLFGIGVLLGLAASPPLAEANNKPEFYYVQRQLVYGGMALIAMFFTSMMSPRAVRRSAVIGFAFAFAALILLPVFGSDLGKGAVRWYRLGFGTVQPSEFLKPMFVVVAGWMMASEFDVGGPPGKRYSLFLALAIVGLLVIQPDFGQACLVLFSWAVMYFAAGASILLIVGLVMMVVIGGALAYSNSEHFARRIDGFLSADVDPTTQIGYATNAIREGGFFGVGVGEGQVKWSLPDAHTDFIIAVAAEEYGLICVMAIIALYCTVVLRSLWRLLRERDPFTRLAGAGLACAFGAQAFINMGVAVRLLPAKGMTLPFVSYGGSSLIASGLAIGMLLAFTRTRPQGQIGDILTRPR